MSMSNVNMDNPFVGAYLQSFSGNFLKFDDWLVWLKPYSCLIQAIPKLNALCVKHIGWASRWFYLFTGVWVWDGGHALIMHRGLYGACPKTSSLLLFWISIVLKENFYNCDDVAKICKVGHNHFFAMDMFTDAQWQMAYHISTLSCILHIIDPWNNKQWHFESEIYRECFSCMSAFNTVVSRRMNRQTCSCACAKGLCVPHVPISRAGQKSAQKRPFCQAAVPLYTFDSTPSCALKSRKVWYD